MKLNRIVKLTIKKEHQADFIALFHQNSAGIESFKGCEKVELLKSGSMGNENVIFFTYSIWDHENSLNTYRESPFFQQVWQSTKKLFGGKPEAWSTYNI